MNIDHTCFGFLGLGLIGGSIAKTIRRISPKARIIAYNRTLSVLEQAKSEGTVDMICETVDYHFSECDYIFLCMPVSYNAHYLKLLSPVIKESCILTDVGSVKSDIHKHAADLGLEKHFIGGHPMAGSERTGYENASSRLLEHAYYIITPTPLSSKQAVDNYYNLIVQLGALPLVLNCQEHDHITAHISHIPHVMAAGLVHLVQNEDTDQQLMKAVAAGGFRDTTRIASSSPVMWQQICMTNQEHICQALDSYIDILLQFRSALRSQSFEEIYEFFKSAQEYRKNL